MIGTPCEYVQKHYGVPACIGRRVIAYGKPGIITTDFGHYIGIVLDGSTKRQPGRYHPEDGIEYGEMAEQLPKPPRRTNYDQFEEDDTGLYFHEWLGINIPKYEKRGGYGDWHHKGPVQYRMYRYARPWDFAYRDVEGGWAQTMKAAKASYKEALQKHRAELRTQAHAA